MAGPFEEYSFRADNFASGLAAMKQFKEMLAKSEQCSNAVNDRELPLDVRTEALKEQRHLNLIFSTVAAAREAVGGISA
jgi:glycyl-tRNA synthetase (class II)